MPELNAEYQAFLDHMMQDHPIAKPGKLFGYPGYKVNGKLALGLVTNGIIAKVGKARADEMAAQPEIEIFSPMENRLWKDWIIVKGNVEQHKVLYEEAVQYVLNETGG